MSPQNASRAAPARPGNDPQNSSSFSGDDSQILSQKLPATQAPKRDPIAVREARLRLIREELYGDLDEIRIFAERGLRALEVENDLDLGRAFDQSVKHFRAVTANLKALILVKTGAPI